MMSLALPAIVPVVSNTALVTAVPVATTASVATPPTVDIMVAATTVPACPAPLTPVSAASSIMPATAPVASKLPLTNAAGLDVSPAVLSTTVMTTSLAIVPTILEPSAKENVRQTCDCAVVAKEPRNNGAGQKGQGTGTGVPTATVNTVLPTAEAA